MTKPIVYIQQFQGLTVDYRVFPADASVEVIFIDWSEVTPEFNHEGAPAALIETLKSVELLPADAKDEALTNIEVWVKDNEPEAEVLSVQEREEWFRLEMLMARVKRDLPVNWT